MSVVATSANGLAKKQFGKINDDLPAWSIVTDMIPFEELAKTGELFEELIVVSRSHGVTFARSTRQTAYTLQDARSWVTQPAQATSSEIVMVERIAYGMLAAAEAKGQKAYESAIKLSLKSIATSHRFYQEYGYTYGGSGTGTGSNPGLGITATAGASATTAQNYTITQASWASGIWAQMKNAEVDCWDPTLVTKRNGTSPFIVTGVTHSTRIVTMTCATAADAFAVAVGDVFVPRGSRSGSGTGVSENCDGLDSILTNTGTLFALSASTYDVWAGNVKSAGSAPATILTLHGAMNMAVGRGLAGEFVWLVNNFVFQDLVDDTTALRRFTEDTKTSVTQGTMSLDFYGANNGRMRIISHPMLKCGDAMGFQPKAFKRGGDSELVRGLPGTPGEDFFYQVDSKAAVEIRNFSSTFIMPTAPSHAVKLYNIVPRSAP